MRYRVDYQPIRKVRNLQRCSVRLSAPTALIVILDCLLFACCCPMVKAAVHRWSIPWHSDSSEAAFESFAKDVSSGSAVPDSLRTLCVRVFEDSASDQG